jgi:hypothetical protein
VPDRTAPTARVVAVVRSKSARDAAVAEVATHGWTVARETKRGYLIMRRACGKHQETLHKTPSNPNHFRNKVARMVSECSRPVL